uniref:DUF8003 domain-containing protein n=1 Tax=Cannabis sativa TaxID=3483 RepID=A0A803NU05_CANSA
MTRTRERASTGPLPDMKQSLVRETSYEQAFERTQTRDCKPIGPPHATDKTNRNSARSNLNNEGNQSPPLNSLHKSDESQSSCDPTKGKGPTVKHRGRTQNLYQESEEYEIQRVKINELLHTQKYFHDEQGVGSLNTLCELNSSLSFEDDVYIEGKGSLHILPGVNLSCPLFGCSIWVNVSKSFTLGRGSAIVAGLVSVNALNANLSDGSLINVTGLAGEPPEQTSGTPHGLQGSGGGHGGRGASCVSDNTKLPDDVWGGDTYSWTSLEHPDSYGSRGGTTSKEVKYGGEGGGRIWLEVNVTIDVSGSLLAEGGEGGLKGGGGSGGSIFIKANRMTGIGRISAAGGNGFAGGGGGRISIHVFSRHDDTQFLIHGGRSLGCPENSGGAGTYYDAVPRILIVSNHNKTTQTDTLLMDFPKQPLWTNVYIQNHAKALVPLFWSRVQESSRIRSNANLGVHGQGFLNLSGPGNLIEAQRLILSLFYSVNRTPRLYCNLPDCPAELIHPPEDCNVNSTLAFTIQICRVEQVVVEGTLTGSIIHFHWVRAVTISSSGVISASGLGCTDGMGQGKIFENGLSGGGGHGGKGGHGYYNGNFIEGGVAYGNAGLPCELGSGSGNVSLAGATTGGGIIVMGSMERSLLSLSVDGSLKADGESFGEDLRKQNTISKIGPGGGSGGTILLFVQTLTLGDSSTISTVGGHGSPYGGGGGGGGRIHFHWSEIPVGDAYLPIAYVKGRILTREDLVEVMVILAKMEQLLERPAQEVFMECPIGTYKNVSGSDRALCYACPFYELPHRAVYVTVRGGVTDTPCPYKCTDDRYHMPHCYTALEEVVYTFGGPWLFGFILLGILILLALVLSVARMKYVSGDEVPAILPARHGSQIDHSFPFLESLNEVLETHRNEESRNHVHRMYFLGPNTFSEPWHLTHSPPQQVKEIVHEDAFNRFVDEINGLAAYQWWEGSIFSTLSILAYPLAWLWLQRCRKSKLQQLREYVRSEYDHSCLRSCRSRALYEGLKVAATSDLMLAYIDFFLGGDEKRVDLPLGLHQRFPVSLVLEEMEVTWLLSLSTSIPPTIWYRLVAGLNAQLRLVCCGHLKVTLSHVISWLETHANPTLKAYGVHADLAWFQHTASEYCQFGLVVSAAEKEDVVEAQESQHISLLTGPELGEPRFDRDDQLGHLNGDEHFVTHKRFFGEILRIESLRTLKEKTSIFYLFSFIVYNTKPVGHQDLVGLVISILLLGDFSLAFLTLLQQYSISLLNFFFVLFILPLGLLFPFPAGISALFSQGPRRSAGLARLYALWNLTSMINVVVAFICGLLHYTAHSNRKRPDFQSWNFSMDESEWWVLPSGLAVCKIIQARLIDRHVANQEIQDHYLYSNDPDVFWQS